MVQVTLTNQDFQALDDLELDDLYANLALTDAGTGSSVGFAVAQLSSMKGVMSAEASLGTSSVWSWLVQQGKALFNKLWPAAKTLVCQLYKQKDEDTPIKDWVTVVATAIAGLLGLGAAAAVFIVKIAIQLGLDSLCEAPAAA